MAFVRHTRATVSFTLFQPAVVLFFALLLVGAHFAKAMPEPPALLDGRKALPLNGQWQCIVDPQDVGATSINGHDIGTKGFWHDRDVDHGRYLQEYDFNSAAELSIPGSWNSQVPELLFYEGVVWLRRNFDIVPESSNRYYLHFGAVNYHATVYLNGEELGSHEGGFTPFAVEATAGLKKGKNSLVLRVDSRSGPQSIPAERFDWWNHGGITRDVHLLATPQVFIRNFRLQIDPTSPEYATGWVDIAGATEGVPVNVRIGNAKETTVLTSPAGRASLQLAAPGERWSPASPTLHDVTVSIDGDSVSEKIGFRTLGTDGSSILLNGKPVFLRGISAHEVTIDREARPHSEADARNFLNKIREMSGNYVRLAHYPHNGHVARVADEMGILLWEEIPVYWSVDFESEAVLDKARDMLTALLDRDGNRASVAIWSVANETPVSDSRNAFLTSLVDHVKSIDSTRLVSAAAISTRQSLEIYARIVGAYLQGKGENLPAELFNADVSDPLDAILDIVAYNEYLGWYDAALLSPLLGVDEPDLRRLILEIIPRMRFRAVSGKPLVLSELGAGALKGRNGDRLELWTEDYQAAVYAAQVKMIANSPDVAGMSPWVLKDMRSPRRPMPMIQDYYNRKGILDESGNPKQAFKVLSDFYDSGQR